MIQALFSNCIKLLSYYVSINSFIKLFLFFSFRPFYLSTQFICILTCSSLEFSAAFYFVFHSVSEFLFFVLFWMQWKLVTANKAKFPLQKTFSKTLAWSMLCIRLSLHHEKHMLPCPPTSAIVSSKAHGMSCFHTWNFKF